MSGNKQATIVEIARRANTSVATVSRVLSGSDYPVAAPLRKAVEEAAEACNYVPNAIGQSLRNGRSNDIGVIVPNFSNPFYAELITGVEAVCRQEGYNPIFCSSNSDREQELKNIRLLRQKCVEGLLISSVNRSKEIQSALRLYKNVVLFDQEAVLDTCDYVSFDFESGGFQAMDYLLKKGHRRIAFLAAPLEKRSSRQALYSGCMKAVEQTGDGAECIKIVSDVEVEDYKIWEYENGRNLAEEFLNLDPMPTAAFVYNDITAISVMSHLMSKGIQIPDEVSIVGFDNIIMSGYATPPLTTISQSAFETGANAARIILDRITGKNHSCYQIKMRSQIIERSSVKEIH